MCIMPKMYYTALRVLGNELSGSFSRTNCRMFNKKKLLRVSVFVSVHSAKIRIRFSRYTTTRETFCRLECACCEQCVSPFFFNYRCPRSTVFSTVQHLQKSSPYLSHQDEEEFCCPGNRMSWPLNINWLANPPHNDKKSSAESTRESVLQGSRCLHQQSYLSVTNCYFQEYCLT